MIQRKLCLLFIIAFSTQSVIFADGGIGIGEFVGIELDAGFAFATTGDIDMSGLPATVGFSITAGLDKFVGIGFYSKFVFPEDVWYTDDYFKYGKDYNESFKLGKDYGDLDVWLIDFFMGL
ncbi:MAG: hypothetical protein LBK13_01575 [Spirochaetales bacterium]|jgi:hypothetical protein|nr:hypothetical protein [Spirochaetales bacterium]